MEKQVTIRKYGARLLTDSKPLIDVFFLQNQLWNKLVEIERDNTDKYRAIVTSSDTELSDLQEHYDKEETALEAVRKQRNLARQTQRSKKIEGAENYAARIKEHSATLKELRIKMRERRTVAKEAAKPKLEKLEENRRELVKQAVKNVDLWWCHSETVLQSFKVARGRAFKENAKLRFKRFEAVGGLGVRFSKGFHLSQPKKTNMFNLRDATPEELGHLKAQSRKKKIMAVDIRCGKPDDDGCIPIATFLVTIQNGAEPLMNTDLKTITVKRTLHIGKPKWHMVLMFVNDTPEPADMSKLPQKAVGIDFGFRQVQDMDKKGYGLRVASLCASDDSKQHIILPPEFIDRMHRADRLRSKLDSCTNDFWLHINKLFTDDVVKNMPEDDLLRVLLGKARRAKRPYANLMQALVRAHTETPVLGADTQKYMYDWAYEANKLAVAAHGVRRKTVEYRTHIFRNAAAEIVKKYGLIAVKNTDFAGISKLKKIDGEDTELHERARANRVIASPSDLRLAICNAALRENCQVVKVPAKDTTTTCAECGHIHDTVIKDLTFVCDACGAVHDQDENSARICLEYAIESNG